MDKLNYLRFEKIYVQHYEKVKIVDIKIVKVSLIKTLGLIFIYKMVIICKPTTQLKILKEVPNTGLVLYLSEDTSLKDDVDI